MLIYTKENRELFTPEYALEVLKEGNKRFVNNIRVNRNLLQQKNETSSGQFPFAAILSCIDSRTSAELIFDQGLGDIFSIRIAGNILNTDILGSLEFACKIAGSKLIVVLGHTNCGAIQGACNHVQLGHITSLLAKIQPAIEKIKLSPTDNPLEYLRSITKENVYLTVKRISQESKILKEMAQSGEIKIIGGLHDLETGHVQFFE